MGFSTDSRGDFHRLPRDQGQSRITATEHQQVTQIILETFIPHPQGWYMLIHHLQIINQLNGWDLLHNELYRFWSSFWRVLESPAKATA